MIVRLNPILPPLRIREIESDSARGRFDRRPTRIDTMKRNATPGLAALTLAFTLALGCDVGHEDASTDGDTSEGSASSGDASGYSSDDGAGAYAPDDDITAPASSIAFPSGHVCLWGSPVIGTTECPEWCYRTAVDHMICGVRECDQLDTTLWHCI